VRRKGEGLDALQHVVNSAFRREVDRGKRLVVDALDFRKAKDRELKQMARFLIDKVRSTGVPQEIGPLNSYSRRLVHLEVSNEPDMASESIGDGTTKVIVISRKQRQPYQAHDLLTDVRYLWHGTRNYVELNPQTIPAHIFVIRRKVRTEHDFDYYL
jgi:hypothetical protein